jgi:hypothetical protein
MPDKSQKDSGSQDWKPSLSPWLIAASVMLATFMELLDTSIASELSCGKRAHKFAVK